VRGGHSDSKRASGLTKWLSRDSISLWSSLCNNRTVFSVRGRCGGYIATVTEVTVFSFQCGSEFPVLGGDSHAKFVEDKKTS
jgi:hypothetical protein